MQGCPLLQGGGGLAFGGLHAPHRTRLELSVWASSSPLHEKDRGQVTGLAHLITAHPQEEGLPGQRHRIPPLHRDNLSPWTTGQHCPKLSPYSDM